MRTSLLMIWIILLPVFVFSQDIDQLSLNDSVPTDGQQQKVIKKLDTGVDVNMGYMVASNGYNGPYMSLTPHVNYPLNDRFWLSAGISAGFGSVYSPLMNPIEVSPQMLPMTRLFIYAQGNYQLSERMVVNGTVYKEVSEIMVPTRDASLTSTFSYQGMSVGVNYKITKNISFGAQLHINSPSGSGYYSPYKYGNPGYVPFYSPYGW